MKNYVTVFLTIVSSYFLVVSSYAQTTTPTPYNMVCHLDLEYSTYLGGNYDDNGRAIAVDALGFAYVCGETYSDDFPTENPYQGAKAGDDDAFVAKLSSTGSYLIYSTYLGGGCADIGQGIALSGGSAYLTGSTYSIDFPMENPYQGIYGGGDGDAFVSKLSSTGSYLI